MSVLMKNEQMIAGLVPSEIKYMDTEVPSTTISAMGNQSVAAPRHDKNIIGCIFINNESINVLVIGQPIYRPNGTNKWTTTIFNPHSDALTVSGYIRWFYIE